MVNENKYDIDQLRKAWGAGRAMQGKGKKKYTRLVKHYFATWKDGDINMRGQIISEERNDHYLCEIFSAFDGTPIARELFAFEEMINWTFYPTYDEFVWMFDKYYDYGIRNNTKLKKEEKMEAKKRQFEGWGKNLKPRIVS